MEPDMNKNLIQRLYPWLLLAPLYLFLGLMFYWLVESKTTFPSSVISKRVLNPELHSGQNLFTEGVFKRDTQCRINRIHTLVNDFRQIRVGNDDYYIYPDNLPIAIQNVINIPIDVQPGEYQYIIQTTYFCNPMDYLIGRHRDVPYGKVTILPPVTTTPQPVVPAPVNPPVKGTNTQQRK
jgi:hypothetical protein